MSEYFDWYHTTRLAMEDEVLTAAEIEEWEMDNLTGNIVWANKKWDEAVKRAIKAEQERDVAAQQALREVALCAQWEERAVKAEQQRDELLRVLKFAQPNVKGTSRDKIDAVIAKIEGENNGR